MDALSRLAAPTPVALSEPLAPAPLTHGPRWLPVQARVVAGGALACGIVGDLLVDDFGIGLAVYLVTVTLALRTAIRATAERDGFAWPAPGDARPLRQSRVLLAVATLFAVLIAGRANEAVSALNMLVAVGATAIAAALVPGTGLTLFLLRVHDLVRLGITVAGDVAFGALRFVFGESRFVFGDRAPGSTRALVFGVTRAVLLAVTATTVLGALLAAGDPVFQNATRWLTEWDVGEAVKHTFKTAFFTIPVMGVLYGATRRFTAARAVTRFDVPDDGPAPAVTTRSPLWNSAVESLLGAVERVSVNRLDALVTLGTINALFAAFVRLQLRVLFGGQAYVAATTGLTLAQYARNGFFALAFTSALTIGILLLLDATLDVPREDVTPDDATRGEAPAEVQSALLPATTAYGDAVAVSRRGLAAWPVSRALSFSLLGFTGAVLLSAATRMLLYVQSFGFTVDRIVALAIISWLGTVALLFAGTVLRGRSRYFLASAAGTGLVTLLALNAVNVEGTVVRSVLSAAQRGQDADVTYVIDGLRADAVPAIVAELTAPANSWTTAQRTKAAKGLIERWGSEVTRSPWSLSVAEWRARRAVRDAEPTLQALALAR